MSDSAPSTPTTKRPKGRSPAYPAISLDKAVQRVGQLYRRDKQYAVPVANVAGIWGYANLNGPAALTVSALKKFGLVDDEGAKEERTITVTDLAVQILNHPSSDARKAAIKESALLPPIHREMWEQYGVHLPSDANLEWRLTRDRGFTESGAKEFIREYRDTIAFAALGEGDASEAHADEDVAAEDEAGDTDIDRVVELEAADESALGYSFPAAAAQQIVQHRAADQSSQPAVQSYPIPIALQGRPPVIISGAFPLSEAEWTQFKAVLDAMRPVLVEATAPAQTQEG